MKTPTNAEQAIAREKVQEHHEMGNAGRRTETTVTGPLAAIPKERPWLDWGIRPRALGSPPQSHLPRHSCREKPFRIIHFF